jgi:hypothetical protein
MSVLRGCIPVVAMSLVAVASACSSPTRSDRLGEPTVGAPVVTSEPGVPSNGSHVEDPVGAAVTYVATTDGLMGHSPIGRQELLGRLLVPSVLAEQAAALEDAAARMAATLGVPVERLVWIEAPLTATLIDSGAASASVDVWTVSILGAPDVGLPQQVWRTVHVDLELIDGRWLVSAATADAGPAPAANELALPAGWDEFAVVAAWPPVVVGLGL